MLSQEEGTITNNNAIQQQQQQQQQHLAKLESVRDKKRLQLEKYHEQINTIKQSIIVLEKELIDLDNTIDDIEKQVCYDDNYNDDIDTRLPIDTNNNEEQYDDRDQEDEVTRKRRINKTTIVPPIKTSTSHSSIQEEYNNDKQQQQPHKEENNVIINDEYDIQEYTQTQAPFKRNIDLFYDETTIDDNENDTIHAKLPRVSVASSTYSTRTNIEALPLTYTREPKQKQNSSNENQHPDYYHDHDHEMEELINEEEFYQSQYYEEYDDDYYYGNSNNNNTANVSQQHQQQQQHQQHQNSSTTARSTDPVRSTAAAVGTISSISTKTNSNNIKTYPWTQQIYNLLIHTFKVTSFRDQQKDIIDATLLGHDVFVIMRTGGGKSLTYQLPALYEYIHVPEKKITFVISPLLSLIHDQVEQMNQFFPNSATCFTSGIGAAEHSKRWELVRNPNSGICIVFITPEKVSQSNKLCSELEKLNKNNRLGRFVIDECHCACQWGHDFRPDYTQLGKLKSHFNHIPIIAVTATASDTVRDDVCKILRLSSSSSTNTTSKINQQLPYRFFRSTANRPNLHYSVQCKYDNSKEDVIVNMVSFIKEKYNNDAGIVYTYSRKDADTVAKALCQYNIIAKAYHSDISTKNKEDIHYKWMENKVQVVVATIAFGLGINKPNVRFVLHHTISKTLEGYYQESGRAGRDGNYADCILYYSPKDFTKLSKMVHGSASEELLLPMVRYAQESGNDAICKAIMLTHLGEPDCPNIKDVKTQYANETTYERDVGLHAQILVQLLHLRIQQGTNTTPTMLAKDWRTNGIDTPDFLKANPPQKDNLSADECDRIIVSLILSNIFKTNAVWNAYDTVIYLILGHKAQSLLDHPNPMILVRLPIRQNLQASTSATKPVAKTKASKQAAARKSVPANGQEWLTSKNTASKKGVTTKKATSKKAAAGTKKTKGVAKSKAKKSIKKRGGSQKTLTAAVARSTRTTKKTPTAKQGHLTVGDNNDDTIIELLSSDDSVNLPSDDENEFS